MCSILGDKSASRGFFFGVRVRDDLCDDRIQIQSPVVGPKSNDSLTVDVNLVGHEFIHLKLKKIVLRV